MVYRPAETASPFGEQTPSGLSTWPLILL